MFKVKRGLSCVNLQNIDDLLHYLKMNLHKLCDKMDQSLYPYIITELWTIAIRIFNDTLLEGVSERKWIKKRKKKKTCKWLYPEITFFPGYYKYMGASEIICESAPWLLVHHSIYI